MPNLLHLGPDLALDLAKVNKEIVYLFVEFGGQPLQVESGFFAVLRGRLVPFEPVE